MSRHKSCKEGLKLGRWTLVSKLPKRKLTEQQRWKCVCECGVEGTVYQGNLISGKSKSCGCLRVEVTSAIGKVTGKRYEGHGRTHGMRKSAEYRIWTLMKNRTTNVNSENYPNYGGRGITLDPRWESFENFFADMGARPNDSLSLERVDNSLGYSKHNCVWATKTTQARNTRTNRRITWQGETKCLSEWAEQLGINYKTMHTRLSNGWSVQRAFTTPVKL